MCGCFNDLFENNGCWIIVLIIVLLWCCSND